MTKRAFIIHGWQGNPNGAWRPWLKNELEKENFKVQIPPMPGDQWPQMTAWTETIQKAVGNPDENCYLIGHSLGCISILRYLESLPEKTKVAQVILVAGFISNLGYEELDPFFQTKINWEKLKSHCSDYTVMHSDNDYYVSLNYADIFKEKLGAKVIVQPGMGHFNEEQEITELPILLDLIHENYRPHNQ